MNDSFELCQCGHPALHHYDDRGPCYSRDGEPSGSNDCDKGCMEFVGTGEFFKNWLTDWDYDFVHPVHGQLTLDHLQTIELRAQ